MKRISYVLPEYADCRFKPSPGHAKKNKHSPQSESKQSSPDEQPMQTRRCSDADSMDMACSAPVYLTLIHDYETFEPQWLHLRRGDLVQLLASRPRSECIRVATREGHTVLLPSSFCQVNTTRSGCIQKRRRVSFDASMNTTIPPEPEYVSDKEVQSTSSCTPGSYSKLIRRLENKGRAVMDSLRRSYSSKKRQENEVGGKDVIATAIPPSDRISSPLLSHCSFVTEEFKKKYQGTVTVLYDFNSLSEDEISVQAGQSVMLLNKEDADWVWVRRFDGEEGFVPANYTTKPVCMDCQQYLSSLRDIRSEESESERWREETLSEQKQRHEASRQPSVCIHDSPLSNTDQISLLSFGVRFEHYPSMQSTLI